MHLKAVGSQKQPSHPLLLESLPEFPQLSSVFLWLQL